MPTHVHRQWLRRIGRYVPGADPNEAPRRGPGEPDDAGEEQALTPDDDGEGEPQPMDMDDPQAGEDAGEQPLHIPPEVAEQRAREAEQAEEGPRNPLHAPQAFSLQGHYQRGLATRFARMVSKVAEDAADFPAPGDDEWDIPELLQRRFTGRHINQCRMSREKRQVVVVLDTSPSCVHQARLFSNLAQVAEQLGDCELYDAPNFALMAHKRGDRWVALPQDQRDWQFENRVVLAFGDFDGIERICKATAHRRGNRIYWFCCEERPLVLEQQRDYFVKHYRGHYAVTPDMQRLMHAMQRVR
jgi:hypothetical protein